MRSDKEILERIEEIKPREFLGFETSDLINFLSYEAAKPWLKEGVTESDWEPEDKTRDSIIKNQIIDYLPFAWEKANDCRGISANRSLDHMSAWLWMIACYSDEDQEFFDKFKNEYECNYQFYGKDILKMIGDRFDFDSSKHDDGIRSNTEY